MASIKSKIEDEHLFLNDTEPFESRNCHCSRLSSRLTKTKPFVKKVPLKLTWVLFCCGEILTNFT